MLPLHGQSLASAVVKSFLRNPGSRAFLLHGPTGTGKTTTAHYLADAIGVVRGPIGGFQEIASGEQSAEAVRNLSRSMQLRPMSGEWRCIIVNECDRMTSQAETIWLDVLESLPPRCLVIFTTNELGKLSQRFANRCETVEFLADPSKVRQFVSREWARRCPGVPMPAALESAGIREGWSPSYRLALKDIELAQALAESDELQWIVHTDSKVWARFDSEEETAARTMQTQVSAALSMENVYLSTVPAVVRVTVGGPVPAEAIADLQIV